jgi:hypothetical protein
LAALLNGARLSELGPGVAAPGERAALASLSVEELVAPRQLRSREMALACLAGLWLRYDFLDESHRISQDIENPTGSFWHGILHRREGDFSNAKYWFRRVGQHAVYEPLAAAARDLARQSQVPAAAPLLETPDWDPLGFVDLCQQALDGPPPLRQLCRQVQQREWELLFDYCYREAIGESVHRG